MPTCWRTSPLGGVYSCHYARLVLLRPRGRKGPPTGVAKLPQVTPLRIPSWEPGQGAPPGCYGSRFRSSQPPGCWHPRTFHRVYPDLGPPQLGHARRDCLNTAHGKHGWQAHRRPPPPTCAPGLTQGRTDGRRADLRILGLSSGCCSLRCTLANAPRAGRHTCWSSKWQVWMYPGDPFSSGPFPR